MRCDICNSNQSSNLYVDIKRCNNCGHIFANLSLSNNELKKIYDTDYFESAEYKDYKSETVAINKNFNRLLLKLKKHLQNTEQKKLLEVGAAYGFFINIAKLHFNLAIGTEIASEPSRYARENYNIDVRNLDIIEWDFDNIKFDLVCMWDVIEHLHSPNKYLQKLSVNMKKNSIIALTTPDIGSLVARVRKQNWRQIHPPTHVHYFNKKSIETILNNNGFKIIEYTHFGRYRSLGMIFYIIFVLRLKIPIIYNIISFLKLDKVNTYLNLFDEMLVIAKKIN
tara:strand:+ start:1017 stop:1859 length:843 start_codon:yes stop_codon:yes gene_type:complete